MKFSYEDWYGLSNGVTEVILSLLCVNRIKGGAADRIQGD